MTHDVKVSDKSKTSEIKNDESFLAATSDLHKEVNRLFDTIMQPIMWFPLKREGGSLLKAWRWGGEPGRFVPDVDFVDHAGEYLLTAEIPGIDAKDVSADVSDGQLIIKGKKSKCTEHKKEEYTVQERQHGEFIRSFPLPRGVSVDDIKASIDKGVLMITMPKSKGNGAEIKKIPISS
jgi:HSP20 family protein